MMTDEAATGVHRENAPSSQLMHARETPAGDERLEWLFREALRRKQVHPLMELLRRYRSQEGA